MAGKPNENRPTGALNKAGWRLVSLLAVVVAVALLAALLAQNGLFTNNPGLPDHPDALTTLALVLAILAFIVQIFVFVFQTTASAASERRSDELNAETHNALRKIEADSSATQKVLFSQFDRLLDYVVGARPTDSSQARSIAIDEAESLEEQPDQDTSSAPATVADVQRVVREIVGGRDRPVFGVGRSPRAEDQRVSEYLREWPSREEAVSLVAELSTLSPLALAMLTRYGTMELRQRLEGVGVGLVNRKELPSPTKQLINAGLLVQDGARITLTDHGRELVRLLPIGKPMADRPAWFDEVVKPLSGDV